MRGGAAAWTGVPKRERASHAEIVAGQPARTRKKRFGDEIAEIALSVTRDPGRGSSLKDMVIP